MRREQRRQDKSWIHSGGATNGVLLDSGGRGEDYTLTQKTVSRLAGTLRSAQRAAKAAAA